MYQAIKEYSAEMITYEKLRETQNIFKSLTGVSPTEFDELQEAFLLYWERAETERLSYAKRKRAIGGSLNFKGIHGRKYALDIEDQLVLVLCWLRLYLNVEALGFFFGVDKATVSRNSRRVLKVLRQMGDTPYYRGTGATTG